MEDRVDGAKSVGKLEGVGLGSGLSDDLERPLIPGRQFPRRSGRPEILRLDEDFLPYFQNWWRRTSGISWTLIALLSLGDVILKSLVELVEVSHEIAGTSGSDIPIGVDGNGGIVSFVGVEGRNSSGGMRRVVVGEFR